MNKNIIEKIVKASGIKKGELVLLHFWGEVQEEAVLDEFMEAVVAAGAAPFVLRQSRTRNQNLFKVAKESSFSQKYFSLFSQVDTVLDIFTYQPVVLGAKLEETQMQLYGKYMRDLFGALGQVERFLQIRIPTVENAMESGLEPEDFIVRMEQAYDIDYDLLKSECKEKCEELQTTSGMVITTGDNHKLEISYEGRTWISDAGDGDMPCGEVYIAPLEDKTQGEIFYEKLYLEDVGVFENVTFYVKDGVVQYSNHPQVDQFLSELSACDRTVCELGFGMNEQVKDLCGYTVLDEKMQDTFHIAIGNNVMFGGTNQSDLHMDFVGKAVEIAYK